MSLMDVYLPGFSTAMRTRCGKSTSILILLLPRDFNIRQFDRLTADFVGPPNTGARDCIETTFTPELAVTEWNALRKSPGRRSSCWKYFVCVRVYRRSRLCSYCCVYQLHESNQQPVRLNVQEKLGMRSILGASRRQLIGQFSGRIFHVYSNRIDSCLAPRRDCISSNSNWKVIGVRSFNCSTSGSGCTNWDCWRGFAGFTLAGLYPAIYLSSIPPLAALAEIRRSWRTGLPIRHILVFVQLCVSIGVIACTQLMNDQMRYIHDRPTRFFQGKPYYRDTFEVLT